jgi:hypothetical protein
MAQETLKLVITADTKEALANLQTFIQANKGLKEEMQKIGPVSNQATTALSNLSRVAQDAPYGFIGIANNLNPLLESFQRLSTGAKEAGTSLSKELGNALIGPAGIGLALGVVSSLLIKFGDDISAFINKQLSGLGKAFYSETDIVNKAGESFIKASTDITKLRDSFEDFQNGLITKDKFLKEFNSTLGDTIKKTDDLAVAEKFLSEYADDYVQMTFKKAVANLAAAEAAKKQFEAEVTKNKPQAAFKEAFDFTTIFFGGTIESIKDVSKSRQNTIVQEAEKDVTLFESIRKKYDGEADKIQETLSKIFGAPDINKKQPKEKKLLTQKEITDLLRARLRTDTLLTPLEEAPKDTAIEDAKKQHEDYLKWLTGWTKRKEKLAKKNIDDENKDLEDLTKSYERFAMTIASNVTNALSGMYNAMQQGVSAGEALGQMFSRLAQQIAETLIQATLFAAIMSLLPGGSVAAGGKGFFGFFKDILGLADGGVATGPTLAMIGEGSESEAVLPLSKLGNIMRGSFNAGSMSSNSMGQNGQFVLKGNDLVLALQRSNSSLNLRRGI